MVISRIQHSSRIQCLIIPSSSSPWIIAIREITGLPIVKEKGTVFILHQKENFSAGMGVGVVMCNECHKLAAILISMQVVV